MFIDFRDPFPVPSLRIKTSKFSFSEIRSYKVTNTPKSLVKSMLIANNYYVVHTLVSAG